MDQVHLKETSVFYLTKDYDINSNKCEISINYPKTIQLDRLMECGLSDLLLPPKLNSKKSTKFINNLKLELNFRHEQPENQQFMMTNYKLQLKQNMPFNEFEKFNEEKIKEYPISLNDNFSKKDLIDEIESILSTKLSKDIAIFFDDCCYAQKAFLDGVPNEELISIENLELDFTDEKIKLKPGYIKLKYKDDVLESAIETLNQTKGQEINPEDIDPLDPDSFQKELDKKIQDLKSGVRKAIFWLNFNKDLLNLFGIPKENLPLSEQFYGKEYDYKFISPEDETQVDVIYIYSDIVKETHIGSQKANILKVLPLVKDKTYYMFSNVNYIPLRLESIDSIKVSMRDHLGNMLYFDEGFISLTLLIRPIEHL